MVLRAHVRDPASVPLHRLLSLLPPPRLPGTAGSWRPGLRSWVLAGSGIVIVVLALAISANVADHLRDTATRSARENAESIVRGYVDPMLGDGRLGIESVADPEIQAELMRLVAGGDMRRINVYTRDGRILYSTEPDLRGVRVNIDAALIRGFGGASFPRVTTAAAELIPERLPPELLAIYVPIRGTSDGNPIGVFVTLLDARPIELKVDQTRGDVFLIAVAAGGALLALLWLAFSGASRRLASQNRRLSGLNEQLNTMAIDLRRREARFRSLIQNSSDVVVVVDGRGRVTYESDAVRGVLGLEPEELIGRAFEERLHPEDVGWLRAVLGTLPAAEGRQPTAQLRMRHADGAWRWVEVVAQDRSRDPAVGGVVLNFRDVTERRRLEDQLKHEAFHDPLTGLANRALFADRVTHALTRAGRGQVGELAVLFADLDDFKLVNDSLGHAAGDELLIRVADRIGTCVRRQDTAARLGGDEFGILLEDASPAVADEIAGRVLEALRRPFSVGSRQIFVQASIGTALGGDGHGTAEELLRNADAAMYTAKSLGKGRHEFYEPRMHESALHRLELRERLEAALERQEFTLHYQPIIELMSGEVAGVEALVRWRQADGRLALPAEFLGLAEDTGLIVPLGQWVLDTACRQSREWQTGRPGAFTMAVNVASRQLREPAFTASLASSIARSGVRPEDLVLEMTESALLEDGDTTAAAVAGMKGLGVRIALDDFGTGYSSLSHLRRFPIDVLKIDRSFVDGIDGDDEGERALVRSIIRLAHSLDLETVAEGIERQEQGMRLRALGVRYGQGFHYARPMEALGITELLRKRAARLAG
ncbi:MAG TPA: EAL domain-containing protein [Candidatus Limnocylindria bacterium]|nr:EAL domain-containing protein [Candidatus Limnocylindria bacterium]